MRTGLLAVIAGLGAAACTGKDGAAGMNGTNGMNGSNGMDGNDIILSDRAKHGLDIAPVALDLKGKDGPTIEKIGQGSYWVNAVIDCSGCHSGQAGYLAGGVQFPFDASGDYVISRNLTPDPTGLMLTEDQFVEALTTGRDFTNHGGNGLLIVMPWYQLRWLHTDDLKAIYAYLKAIPAVAHANSADHKGLADQLTPIALPTKYDRGAQTRDITPEKDFMGNPLPDPDGELRGYEVNPLPDIQFQGAASVAIEAQYDRGSYLVNAAACNDCHTNPPYTTTPGPDLLKIDTTRWLGGGGVFTTPPGLGATFGYTRSMAKNLLGEQNGFFNEQGMTFTKFATIIATGTHVDDPGAPPLAWPMPWGHFRNMTSDDLAAVYTYLKVNAQVQPITGAGDKATQMAAVYCDATHACPAAFTSCHMDAASPQVEGNQCVGNTCTDDSQCGACQHCVQQTTGPKRCAAPDPTNGADQACMAAGI